MSFPGGGANGISNPRLANGACSRQRPWASDLGVAARRMAEVWQRRRSFCSDLVRRRGSP